MLWIIVVLLILFLLRIPIAFALGITSLIGIFVSGTNPIVLAQQIISGIDSFTLIAVPLFVLAGELMTKGGISSRLVHFAQTLVGHLTSGLAIVVIIACTFFAAVSGSAIATTAAIGGMMIPHMLKNGYDKRFSAALIPAAGTIGPIIPPSIIMIVYGVMAGVSIGDLFMAGVIPGLLMAVSLVIYSIIVGKKRGYKGKETRSSFKEILLGFKDAILAIIMPIIIIGGIVSGIFTPTESGVIAVVYALILGMIVYRELSFKDLPKILYKSTLISATILFIVACASSFQWILTRNNVSAELGYILSAFADDRILFLLVVTIILLIAGMFLETTSAILIFTPLLLPLAIGVGVDPVHFGILMCVNLAVGMITPPLGTSLFVSVAIADIEIGKLMRDLIPIIFVMIIVTLMVTYIPQISLFLPNLLNS